MKSLFLSLCAAGLLAAGASSVATAASITAQSGFGEPIGSCKDVSKSTPFQSGVLVAGNDWTSVCVGFYSVTLDTVAKTLTLTGIEHGNYDRAYLEITGINEVAISSFSTVSFAGLFDPDYYGDPASYGAVPTPQLSFTASSLRIDFSSVGGQPPQFTFDGDGGTAVFSYGTAAIPEPATWAFMIAGFGMAGAALRRRQVAAAA